MSKRTNNFNRNNMGGGGPTNVNVDLSTAEDIVCENCGNYTFIPVMLMKRLSALLSPTGQEAVIPIQSFSCNACGWINKEFLPTRQKEEPAPQEQSPQRPKLVIE